MNNIQELLSSNGIEYDIVSHEAVYTSEEASKVRGTTMDQGAKALVMKADKQPILVVIASHLRVDPRKFKSLYKIKDLRLISPAEVTDLTGLTVGSVPPFGNLMDLPTFVDQSLLLANHIAFNAGSHTTSIIMKCADFISLVQPEIGVFAA